MSEALDPYKKARELGDVEVIPSDDRHLQLDLDCGTVYAGVLELLKRHRVIADAPCLVTTSRNGRAHLYLELAQPLPVAIRIGLQACLSSDPLREAFGLLRCITPQEQPESAMFETFAEAPRVREWLDQVGTVRALALRRDAA